MLICSPDLYRRTVVMMCLDWQMNHSAYFKFLVKKVCEEVALEGDYERDVERVKLWLHQRSR